LRAEKLINIDLEGNYFRAEGVSTLIKANWENISNINLSNNFMIKTAIKLETKDAII
jgi:hypothetical protein